jgi:hypothetical protein
VLEDIVEKNVVAAAERRELVERASATYEISERQACDLLKLCRTYYRYQAKALEDELIRESLQNLAARKPRERFPKMFCLSQKSVTPLESQASAADLSGIEAEFTSETQEKAPEKGSTTAGGTRGGKSLLVVGLHARQPGQRPHDPHIEYHR